MDSFDQIIQSKKKFDVIYFKHVFYVLRDSIDRAAEDGALIADKRQNPPESMFAIQILLFTTGKLVDTKDRISSQSSPQSPDTLIGMRDAKG